MQGPLHILDSPFHILHGDHAVKFIVAVQNGKTAEMRFLESSKKISNTLFILHRDRCLVHYLFHLYGLHDVHIPTLFKAYAPLGKFQRINGI